MACLPPLPATPAAPVRQPGPCWQLRLLGDTMLTRPDGQAQRLPGAVATELLALLALAPDRAHPRETLIELLWPGVDLAVGRNRRRQLLSALKAALSAGDERAPVSARSPEPCTGASSCQERLRRARYRPRGLSS